MPVLCCNKIYGSITNHNNGYDNGDNNGNDDNNAASRSGSGPIFYLIATPGSRLGLAEEYWATTMTALRPQ